MVCHAINCIFQEEYQLQFSIIRSLSKESQILGIPFFVLPCNNFLVSIGLQLQIIRDFELKKIKQSIHRKSID